METLAEQVAFIQWINKTFYGQHGHTNRSGSYSDVFADSLLPPRFQSLSMSIILGVNAVLGVIGNALLCFAANQPEISPHSYSVFLVWLSITFTTMLVLDVSGHFMSMADITTMIRTDIISATHLCCRFYALVSSTCVTLSSCLQILISVDRYVSVAHPLKKRVFCTLQRAREACAVALVMSVSASLPDVVMVRASVEPIGVEGALLCMYPQSFIDYISYVLPWMRFVPCVVFFVFSVSTLRAIRKSNQKRTFMTPFRVRIYDNTLLKTTVSLFMIPTFDFFVLLPVQVFGILASDTFGAGLETDLLLMLDIKPYLTALAATSFSASFYLLLAKSKTYRDILWRLLRRLFFSTPATARWDEVAAVNKQPRHV